MSSWLTISSQVLAAAAAFLVAVGVIWRKGVRPLLRGLETLTHLADALPILLQIADEMRPNAGRSLRDAIDRMEQRINRIEQVVLMLERQIAEEE